MINKYSYPHVLFLLALSPGFSAVPAQAIQLVEMSTQLEKLSGEVIADNNRLAPGGDLTESESRVGDVAVAATQATLKLMPINEYVVGVADIPSGPLQVLGDTRWVVKTSTTLHIGPNDWHFADSFANFTNTRGNEKYFVYAVAPNSASGFAPLDVGPSAGGGNGIRLLMTGYFNGGIYTDHFLNDPTVPHFDIGDGFGDMFGVPPGPTFHETLMQFNQGFAVVVDLDAAGVAVGENYIFREHFRLGVGPGVFLEPLQDAFVTIDPVLGLAIPEPSTLLQALSLIAFAVYRGGR